MCVCMYVCIKVGFKSLASGFARIGSHQGRIASMMMAMMMMMMMTSMMMMMMTMSMPSLHTCFTAGAELATVCGAGTSYCGAEPSRASMTIFRAVSNDANLSR